MRFSKPVAYLAALFLTANPGVHAITLDLDDNGMRGNRVQSLKDLHLTRE
jgi:hypothetical protein